MMEVALFGAGRIGKIHGGNVVRQPGARLKYVVDVNAEAARALAQTLAASVTDVDTAMADPAVKGVVIASSTDTHADLILRELRRGGSSAATVQRMAEVHNWA
jgi:myo-inositol 2-dehydrogenase/D-chiro-inositol 1-dehydrogenase